MAITKNTEKPETAARPIKFNGQTVNAAAPKPAMRPTGGPVPGSQPGAFTGSEPKNAGAGYQYQGPTMMANQLNQPAQPQQAGPGNPVPSLNEMVQAMSKHVTGIQSGFQKWLENVMAGMRQSSQAPISTPINPNPVSGPVLGPGMGGLQNMERGVGGQIYNQLNQTPTPTNTPALRAQPVKRKPQ